MGKKKDNQGDRKDLDNKPFGRAFKVGEDSRMAIKNAKKNKIIGNKFEQNLLKDPLGNVVMISSSVSGAHLEQVHNIIKQEEKKCFENIDKRLKKEVFNEKSSPESTSKSPDR